MNTTGIDCRFDLGHYAEILSAAETGGYRWARFDEEPSAGIVFLRHDVDLSLDAALQMGRLEAEHGVRATYFLMTESVFYNLASPEGTHAIAELSALGHAVGHHGVHPTVEQDERFDPVMAWHNPEPEYMKAPIAGAVNVMQEPWFDPATYRSDSNQHWRSGCPHDELARGDFPWLQLLVHPEIWVYPGDSMGETMRAMVEAERARRLQQLADDRIDMR